MPVFRYTATDSNGKLISGELEAENQAAAAARAESNAWQIITLKQIDLSNASADKTGTERSPEKLSRRDFRKVSEQLAALTEADLPLASGLAHLAEELPHGRDRRVLTTISDQLKAGADLATVLESRGAPHELRALLNAGSRTNRTPEMLWQYVTHVRSAMELNRRVALALAYPVVLTFVALVVVGFLLVFIVPKFRAIFLDFGTELPGITVLLINVSDVVTRYSGYCLFGLVLLCVLVCVVLPRVLPERTRSRLMGFLPLFGSIHRWSSLSRFSHLLAILIENEVPLPEALASAGRGSGDATLNEAATVGADRIAAGETVRSLGFAFREFPTSFIDMLNRSGDWHALVDAMHSIGEMFEGRVRAHSRLVVRVCESTAVVTLGLIVGFIVISLFMPLVKLLNDLS